MADSGILYHEWAVSVDFDAVVFTFRISKDVLPVLRPVSDVPGYFGMSVSGTGPLDIRVVARAAEAEYVRLFLLGLTIVPTQHAEVVQHQRGCWSGHDLISAKEADAIVKHLQSFIQWEIEVGTLPGDLRTLDQLEATVPLTSLIDRAVAWVEAKGAVSDNQQALMRFVIEDWLARREVTDAAVVDPDRGAAADQSDPTTDPDPE